MNLTNHDKFCEGQQIATTGNTASTHVLDFHSHGDDINNKLFLVVLAVAALAGDGAVSIKWQTCALEGFGSGVVETLLTPTALGVAGTAPGTWVVKNAPLPRDLKRYNRLLFSVTLAEGEEMTTAPTFSAYITDNRVEPLS